MAMAEISEAERKKIECWTTLQKYLEGIFADANLEKTFFDRKLDIELYRAENIEIDGKGTRATVVFGFYNVGAYRRIEGANLFLDTVHYRWCHWNSPFTLAVALTTHSKCTLKPDDLEAKLGPYRKQAAALAAVEAGK